MSCQACHDPHDATNSYQLRAEGAVTMLQDGSTIQAGTGAICYQCHNGNRQIHTMDCYSSSDTTASGIQNTRCDTWDKTATQYAGGGYHDATQGPMLEGKQAFVDLDADGTADFSTENSFHSTDSFTLAASTGDSSLSDANNKCVTCHMSSYAPGVGEPGWNQVGGHSFQMVSDIEESSSGSEEGAEASTVENVKACQVCHGEKLTEFNRLARADYDGDGTIEGIQDEVKGLLVSLTTLIQKNDTSHIQQAYNDYWSSQADCATDADCGTQGQGKTGSCNTTDATQAAMVVPNNSDGTTTRSTAAHKCGYFYTLSGSFFKSNGEFVGGDVAYWGTNATMYPATVNGTAGLACGRSVTNGVAGADSCSNLNASGDAGKTCVADEAAGTTALGTPRYVSATTKANLGYKTCNYLATDDIIKRAIWNHNSIYRDESYGIHNAGYAVTVLQGTYKALIRDLAAKNGSATDEAGATISSGAAAIYTYKTYHPQATLR
ncbi:MAG: cytochrome c3 family protein [Deltaproteobacteria bacterium]|nr:MAG: cytochrome c3 family protein [Deltaproteobacteria bacterium]